MALDMTAAVKIQASVSGTAQIDGLQRSLDKVDRQATGLQSTFGRLRGLAGGVGGALGALVPAAGLAGLGALAKKSIDAADNLNDLRQQTGVGVETLSKFGAAAEDSGSSLDEVAKAMGRLSKGIVDPASKTSEALKSIGISSTDASGKVRSVDQIMLDLAAKFATMPDGAQKTALAMQLFGKSGASLIPMLNQGRDALSQYQATMTGEGAAAADQFNDSLNAIARSLAGPFNQAVAALLPTMTQIAQAIATGIQWFSQLPQPIQGAVIVVGGLVAAFAALAPAITAIVTVAGAIGPALAGIGAAIAAVGPLLSGLLPILAAVFTGPIGWIALAVAAGAAIFAFRDQIGQAFQAIGATLKIAAQGFNEVFIKPVAGFFKGLYDGIVKTFSNIANALKAPFEAAARFVKGIVNSILGGIETAINGYIKTLNNLISVANRALSLVKGPQIPKLPNVNLPRFADGGVVAGPTLAMVGEGGEPEYIVPQSKATRFANNWLSGMRGAAAIPRFAEGGVVAPATAQVNIQTGPVMQQGGQNYVTIQDFERGMQNLANSLLSSNRSTGGRRYAGVR